MHVCIQTSFSDAISYLFLIRKSKRKSEDNLGDEKFGGIFVIFFKCYRINILIKLIIFLL